MPTFVDLDQMAKHLNQSKVLQEKKRKGVKNSKKIIKLLVNSKNKQIII